MSDERIWLRHKETGHFWQCPAEAVEDWTTGDLGWEVTNERPEEPNPVVAEHLAWRRALAEQAQQESITAAAGSAPETEE